jgi:hypothetical protein
MVMLTVMLSSMLVGASALAQNLEVKQANFISYFASDTNSDSFTLSGYLPPPLSQYCGEFMAMNIWLFAGGNLVLANTPWSLTASVPPAPYSKCRFLSRAPGIKDLVFEAVKSGGVEKYVYVTLQINNKFDWDVAVDAALPAPPPAGSSYPMFMSVDVWGGPSIWAFDILEVCDYNSSKVKLCAGP